MMGGISGNVTEGSKQCRGSFCWEHNFWEHSQRLSKKGNSDLHFGKPWIIVLICFDKK